MTTFLDLLRQSLIIQGTITLVLLLTICALVLQSRPIPGELWNGFLLILGFYFGSKSSSEAQRTVNKLRGVDHDRG